MTDAQKTVLIVDDSVYLINKLKTVFEKNGLKTFGAGNAQQAIEQYSNLRPDLVTMDIVMPDMDGLKALEELKKLDPGAKVIIISSIAMKEKIMTAVKLGAKNFVIKPFTEDKLMETVNRVLGVA